MHTITLQFPQVSRNTAASLWGNCKQNIIDLEVRGVDHTDVLLCIALRVASRIIVDDLANCPKVHQETLVLAHKVLALIDDSTLVTLFREHEEQFGEKSQFNDLIFIEYVDCEGCQADLDAIYKEVYCRSLQQLLEHPVAPLLDEQIREDIEGLLVVNA